jgi:2-C-methyl-D-erythritol 2,4-cyclodiphosphate synthase
MRIGFGWDSHEFKRGVALKIGGVTLPHHSGLAGHSDGDVLLHALTDALLGAVAAGDIGAYFPPSDPQWKGADSTIFVTEALRQVRRQGYSVANVDSTLVLAAPKIGPHAAKIQQRMAELLGISPSAVGVKAKTPEGTRTSHAAIAHVVVLLLKRSAEYELALEAAAETPQPLIDKIVKQTLKDVRLPKPKRLAKPVKKGARS